MALTPHEDEELRRIHTLGRFGELPATMQSRYDELRSRIGHESIAEPTLDVHWLPVQCGRDDALDDRSDDWFALDDCATGEPVALPDAARRTSLADIAAFEAQLAGDELYAASPHTGGFVPSTWYRAT